MERLHVPSGAHHLQRIGSVRSFLLILVGLLVGACASSRPVGDTAESIVDRTWRVQTPANPSDATVSGPTITFSGDGRIHGSAGCNRYFGSYVRGESGALRITPQGMTRRACSEPVMQAEGSFLEALAAVRSMALLDGRIELRDAEEDLLLILQSARAEAASIDGRVSYLPRIALPPDAVVRVRLEDVSRSDAASTVLAEQVVRTEGRQVPVPFELKYDRSWIDPRGRYVIRAEIRDASGVLLWATDTAVPVLTHGAPSTGVELWVVQSSAGRGQ